MVAVDEEVVEAVDRHMVVVVEEEEDMVHLAVEGTAADIAHEAPDTDPTERPKRYP